MANKIETLSQTAFDTKKAEVLSKELIRKEINISEFEVINDSTIKIQGKNVPITPLAFKRVLRRLRIPHAFARRFETGFGSDGLKQLIQMVKLAKANKNDQTVTLVVDPDKGAIVDILPAGYASISNEAFVNFAEGYIDIVGPAFEVFNVGAKCTPEGTYGYTHRRRDIRVRLCEECILGLQVSKTPCTHE